MVGRADEATLRTAGRTLPRGAARAARLHTGRQRLAFVTALFFFGGAAILTSLGLLSRVTPALFPGQTLPGIPVLDELPQFVKAPSRTDDSGFLTRRVNLLIIGVDKRPGWVDEGGYLTDMIMVATIDPQTKQISLLSFPRDMYIDIHTKNGIYESRINESYGTGFRENGGTFSAGTAQLALDLKENFGIEIDHWMLLDFTGVYTLIDALGGIDVDIPYELSVPDWWYNDESDTPGSYVNYPPGKNHLNGYNAVAFGRYREDSDFYRVKRQQLVMQTALQKVFARGLLNNPVDLWNAYHDTVKTDLSLGEALGYVPLVKETNGSMQMFSLGDPVNDVPTMIGFTTDGGAAVQLWNHENVQYWLSRVFTKAAYAQSNVEILDGYGDQNALRAKALGRYLRWVKGLPTVYFGGEAPVQSETTVTLHKEGKRVMAEDIAKWMGIPATAIRVEVSDDPTGPDVTVVVGKDYKTPGG
ncbi:MAG: LCP family protein [Chloroflexi bacterium]|nr:LCP family protein [Chloroflexota bacterium]